MQYLSCRVNTNLPKRGSLSSILCSNARAPVAQLVRAPKKIQVSVLTGSQCSFFFSITVQIPCINLSKKNSQWQDTSATQVVQLYYNMHWSLFTTPVMSPVCHGFPHSLSHCYSDQHQGLQWMKDDCNAIQWYISWSRQLYNIVYVVMHELTYPNQENKTKYLKRKEHELRILLQ